MISWYCPPHRQERLQRDGPTIWLGVAAMTWVKRSIHCEQELADFAIMDFMPRNLLGKLPPTPTGKIVDRLAEHIQLLTSRIYKPVQDRPVTASFSRPLSSLVPAGQAEAAS